ncbi:MAG: HAD family hydrolase [Clostridia bacterium]|nr:HAD family hydrolase [Clostridia bacterium]
MKYLIFLDIDGTIISDGKIHPRTIDGIRKAQERGHRVFINTGRSMDVIQKSVLEAANPSGIVAGLGAYISACGEILFSVCASREQIAKAMEIADKYDITMLLEGEKDSVSYNGETYLGKEREIFSEAELWERYPDIRISKMTYRRPLSPEATAELEPYFEVFNHPTYSEMGLKGYSKATGMDFLCKKYGIDKAHTIAMGDSDNDMLMLRAAGTAVVMGNGQPDVKKIADFVSIDCTDGGVGYAIEKLILEKED